MAFGRDARLLASSTPALFGGSGSGQGSAAAAAAALTFHQRRGKMGTQERNFTVVHGVFSQFTQNWCNHIQHKVGIESHQVRRLLTTVLLPQESGDVTQPPFAAVGASSFPVNRLGWE